STLREVYGMLAWASSKSRYIILTVRRGKASRQRRGTMAGESRFGVTGLAVMGQNLARNVARHGIPVAVHNRTAERTDRFVAEFGGEGTFTPTHGIAEFVGAIARPRPILIMVKAGQPVDDVIAELT